MSSYGYRLDRALTSVEPAFDGRSALRVLPPGSVLLVTSGEAPAGMIRVLCNDTEYCVFVQDLEARSTKIAVDLRKPAGLCADAPAGTFRWAC
jgi:hypothetical protein